MTGIRRSIVIYCLLLLSMPFVIKGQEYNYEHYKTNDGLAGAVVYDLCQDKDGFIWFATETGLSRYDGSHFKNFTMDDGLPSNEILRVFADTEGRVWICPFKKMICYYYQGKIFTPQNDSLLKSIRLTGFVNLICEDVDKNILLIANAEAILISNKTKEVNYYSGMHILTAGANFPEKGFLLASEDSLYKIIDNKIGFWKLNQKSNSPDSFIVSYPTGKDIVILKKTRVVQDFKDGQLQFINTLNGSWEMSSLYPYYREHFLSDETVNHTLKDRENNIWFATMGDGVYKLRSKEIRTFFLNKANIYSVDNWQNKIVAGSDGNRIFILSNGKADTLLLNPLPQKIHDDNNRVYSTKKLLAGDIIVGFTSYLIKLSPDLKKSSLYVDALKSIDVINQDEILVGASKNVLVVATRNLEIIDTIWFGRSTAVCHHNGKYYIGTTEGLHYLEKKSGNKFSERSISSVNTQINQIISSDSGIIWVATNGSGIIGIKNDEVIASFSTQQGLNSNICKAIFLKDNFLWVGTDKGINKINLINKDQPIVKYSITEGLPSNMINTISVEGSTVYAGTPSGLIYFNETRLEKISRCDLKMLSVYKSGVPVDFQKTITLPYKNNDLRIEFIGLSFRSEGIINYQYRLIGLKNKWESTSQNTIEYQSLPPGNYKFELFASNKYGKESNKIVISIDVVTPYWQTLWFRIAILILLLFTIWYLINFRYKKIRNKERAKESQRQKISDLEQRALRAQMNPHFIFNCINSIQNFIISNNLEATNNYLSKFAHLIRQTLDNSDKKIILISEEVKYLTIYLELEKMRLSGKFDYKINIDENIAADFTYIPNMLLQPFIENSIRHGVRYRKDDQGLIQLTFTGDDKCITCTIEDNGIGRQMSRQLKSQQHIEYQSRGMLLTKERINAINNEYQDKIEIHIMDLVDENKFGTGTKVVIVFPINFLEEYN